MRYSSHVIHTNVLPSHHFHQSDWTETKKCDKTNGQTERFNATLIKLLRVYAEENQTNWHLYLEFVVMAYRKRFIHQQDLHLIL